MTWEERLQQAEKPKRLLDLFCGAGGAAMGYYQAGFHVTGVDIKPQPRYPFEFIQGDVMALELEFLRQFDAIHASPPCQWITYAASQWRAQGQEYPKLLEPIRERLVRAGRPYVIEQPVGKVLHHPLLLNGAMFGLRVKRDRYFETNWYLPMCLLPQDTKPTKMRRPFDARTGQLFYPVGHFSGVKEAGVIMECAWMTQKELAQAIPPAYAKYIGERLVAQVMAEG